MGDTTLSGEHFRDEQAGSGGGRGALGLMIAWSQAEPWRVGEVALLPRRERCLLGRGASSSGEEPSLVFRRLRPGPRQLGAPLQGKGLSRRQLLVREHGEQLQVENVGKAALWQGGRRADSVAVEEGDRIYVEHQLLLLCVERSNELSAHAVPPFPFGEADPSGLVGESEPLWRLRERVAFCARREGHVLILGPSGAGKELCARALHAQSARHARPFVSRNAATIPEGIADAELFGSARNYPNAGMRERAGLVGAADGGTLFLDEIGELPEEIQAHLLRLLDGGEYHRLGEERPRRSDVRLVAATNRPSASLKHDLLPRFALRISVPPLAERRDDIPLLIRAVLRRIFAADQELAARFSGEQGEPRVDPLLVDALLEHDYAANVRDLEQLLLLSMGGSPRDRLLLTPEIRELVNLRTGARPAPSPDEIRACLEHSGGNVSAAWKQLGLSSRDALRRLIRKHRIQVERPLRAGRRACGRAAAHGRLERGAA
jgi:two-component system, NtrC family, response regulator HydG